MVWHGLDYTWFLVDPLTIGPKEGRDIYPCLLLTLVAFSQLLGPCLMRMLELFLQ